MMVRIIIFVIFCVFSGDCLHAQTSAAKQVAEPASEKPVLIEAKGMLKPFREVRLASRSQGVIRQIKEEGSEVKQGDVLVTLEDALETLQVKQQQQVLVLREFEGKAGESLNRSEAISRQESVEKIVNLEIAKIQLAQAAELLDRRRVVAPFPGFVTERLRETGEAVDEFVPVLTLVDLNKLYFETYLPAEKVKNIKEDQPAEIRIDIYPERRFVGRVALISPVVNPASLEFKVKLEIDNKEHLLSAGLSGTCGIMPPDKKLEP